MLELFIKGKERVRKLVRKGHTLLDPISVTYNLSSLDLPNTVQTPALFAIAVFAVPQILWQLKYKSELLLLKL